MDSWVLKAQQWMNSTYRSVSGYQAVTEDGVPGWGTMYGLTRALQHELGITSLSNNFGDGTVAAFTSKIGQITSKTGNKRVVGILQCAMWCKGYSGGTVFGTWASVLDGSIATVRTQLGLTSGSSVDVKLMRSLLTMDAYIRVVGGRDAVRSAQQWLNGRYASHSSYRLVPCDGIYSRDVQYGFMLGIQFEMDMADGVANGNFGPGTQSGLKSKAVVGSGSVDGTKKWVSLFQIALVFNGYDVARTGTFDATTVSTTRTFQSFLLISPTGRGDFDTWAALLVSTGNPDRAVTGVDTSTQVSPEFAQELRASGYSVIGRYLTVTGKAIARGELDHLFDAGFSVVPIMQNYNNAAEYFTYDIGYTQGYQAAMRARQLGFGANTVIFFPVDYDAFAAEVGGILKAYFSGVAAGIKLSVTVPYKIGVYATRYVADQVRRNGWAEAIWVSGMSTGYSGNLGYPMPEGWSYNQIQEVHAKNIDRNAVAPGATPATRADVARVPNQNDELWQADFEFTRLFVLAERALSRQQGLPLNSAGEMVLWYLQTGMYDSGFWVAYTPVPEQLPGGQAAAWSSARSDMYTDAGPVADSLKAFSGEIQHLAATAHGVVNWGDAAGQSAATAGDLGGWSADLLTLWADYRGSLGKGHTVESFITEFLGGSTGGSFSYHDLLADAEGWLIGRRMRQGTSLSDAHRQLRLDAVDDTSILRAFLQERFSMTSLSTSTVLSTSIAEVFEGNWPWSILPRHEFLDDADGPTGAELYDLRDACVKKLVRMAGLPS
ncbi:MAG: glycoside hydrolase domain-containing protein [Curtobacterium sp.]|jgi:peptidoglycan hydrolase-like protein with peptidoglycan-binding domain